MHRRHQAFLNPKPFLQQHVHHRSQAVRRARRIRNDVVIRRIVLLMVHAHHDRDVFILTRRGNDHLLRTSRDVTLRLLAFREQSRRLNHDIHPERLPRQRRWTFPHRQTFDLLPVHHQNVVLLNLRTRLLRVHFLPRTPLHRIILHKVRQIVRRNEVVHRHNLNLLAQQPLVTDCTKHKAADAPETIDTDLDHLNVVGVGLSSVVSPPSRRRQSGSIPASPASLLALPSLHAMKSP